MPTLTHGKSNLSGIPKCECVVHFVQSNTGNFPLLVVGPDMAQIKFCFNVFGVTILVSVRPNNIGLVAEMSYLGANPVL
jgi:hypothetical protein